MQTTCPWPTEGSDGSRQQADSWWDGVQTVTPVGSEILSFGRDAQPLMTNDLTVIPRQRILFNCGLTVSRCVSGVTQNLCESSDVASVNLNAKSGTTSDANGYSDIRRGIFVGGSGDPKPRSVSVPPDPPGPSSLR